MTSLSSNYLSRSEQDCFWREGYLIVDNVVSTALLSAMKKTFNQWVEESRIQDSAYGCIINNLPRFDIEASHSSSKPASRRVNAPIEVSEAFFEAMASSAITDCISDLLGPNVKFHHSKINSKQSGTRTMVRWHQDFTFTPHTNDDVVTALLMLDEVSEKNGPLEVLPGSHRGPLHSLWHDGVFTGAVAEEISMEAKKSAELCLGRAGSACFMHSRLLHSSKPNLSNRPRTLFICVFSAADAIPCSPNPMPNKYEGLIVRGVATNTIRAISYQMALPQLPSTASFFDQQAKFFDN